MSRGTLHPSSPFKLRRSTPVEAQGDSGPEEDDQRLLADSPASDCINYRRRSSSSDLALPPLVRFTLHVLLVVSFFVQAAGARSFYIPGTGFVESIVTPPAVFVFGDSLVDPGNNNYLQTLAKANIPFNGIDFPGGPTGRFCNGRTVVDIICDILSAPYPPAFLNPLTNGSNILRGVSYASGAGGILDSSGANFLNRIGMNQQVSYFQGTTLPQLEAQLGPDATATLLASSLVAIVIGSNDFINNYLLQNANTPIQYTPVQFNNLLLNAFSKQLTALHDLGFRKFYVSAVGPIGCIPHQLALSGQPNCVDSINAQAQDYNTLVRSLLQNLNGALTGAMFLFGEAYDSLANIINNPGDYGFTVVNQGCCGGGLYRGQIQCQPAATVCRNRAEYVFWDPYHPSEASNILLANAFYSGGVENITPINIYQLLAEPLPT